MTRPSPRLLMLRTIINLDISNVFGTLCARLVLDVLVGKAWCDYTCFINVDDDFETTVYELKKIFRFLQTSTYL